MVKILNWLKYYRASLIDGSRGEKNNIFPNPLQRSNSSLVNGIHNKTICVDDRIIIEGSFNWLSATRDANSPYHRKGTSVVIQGTKVKEDIERIKKSFKV